MRLDERRLDPINDTLNPAAPRFGIPWYAVLGIITVCVIVFMVPGCKIVALLLCPSVLGFGWWLTKEDPKEAQFILHDLLLPGEFDPGK